jgi:hypothetical protein
MQDERVKKREKRSNLELDLENLKNKDTQGTGTRYPVPLSG